MTGAYTITLSLLLLSFLSMFTSAANAGPNIVYKKRVAEKGGILKADENLLNNFTHARVLLMAGDRLGSMGKLRKLAKHLRVVNGHRKYKTAYLNLLRVKDEKNDIFIYAPISYEKNIKDPEAKHYIEEMPEYLKNAEWEGVVTSLHMTYAEILKEVNKAYTFANKKKFKRADTILQEVYEDMIKNPHLRNDPIRGIEEFFKEAKHQFKIGETQRGLEIVYASEKRMKTFLKENPDFPKEKKLREIMERYDDIRAQNEGVTPKNRIKISQIVGSMRAKIRTVKIRLP